MSNVKSLGCLVGLSLIGLAATARAQEPAPPSATATPAAAEPSKRKLQIGLAFLPMARGRLEAAAAGMSSTVDGAFAYGVGLSAGYEILPNLVVGIAPQVIFNGKPKDNPAEGGKQWDVMARVAYGYTIPDVITLYAEVLPGYSIFYPPGSSSSKGLVVAAGVGAAMDITQQIFINLGVGYQRGFQSQTSTADYQTNYVRVALGGGVKF
jgi:hypothetical protein